MSTELMGMMVAFLFEAAAAFMLGLYAIRWARRVIFPSKRPHLTARALLRRRSLKVRRPVLAVV
jgi:hypothetical protein